MVPRCTQHQERNVAVHKGKQRNQTNRPNEAFLATTTDHGDSAMEDTTPLAVPPSAVPASDPASTEFDEGEMCDPFGSAHAADYLYDRYLDQTEDWTRDPLRPGRMRVTSEFGKNVLKFAHVSMEEDAHRLKGCEDAFERLYRCNGDGCVACQASVRGAQKVDIEFFYDLDDRCFIGYAAVASGRQGSFGAKLRKACQGQIPCVLKIFRSENGGYLVKRNDSHTFEIGELGQKVLAFRKSLENGEVDLEEILPEMDNCEMRNIPAVGNNLPVERNQ